MSASSKKKLRSAEQTVKLTERQLAEQKEARQMKIYTTVFVVAMVLIIAIAVSIVASTGIANLQRRNATALTLQSNDGSEAINIKSDEMAYFYINYIQNYTQNNPYLSYMLDTTLPLDQQSYLGSADQTWADYFLAEAQKNAQTVYAVSNAAKAAGFTLPAEEQANVEATLTNLSTYAMLYGYQDADTYLKAMYGSDADMETYQVFVERTSLAAAYYDHYYAGLTYDEAALRAADADNYDEYSSYTYHSYLIRADQFLEGGTTGEDGTVTYSDEENAAAAQALEAAKEALLNPEEAYTSPADLDVAIAGLAIPGGSAASTLYTNQLYSGITTNVAQWLSDNRKEGDTAAIALETTDENGESTVTGYYIVYFLSKNDNTYPLANVRHILVSFEGGTTDATGSTVYSDEEIAAAKAKAEELLDQWEAGDATEESFAAMAGEHSTDPGSSSNGGLYENVYPGQMVVTFNDWCFADREPGDTGIVETSYGFHVMYYSGDSDITYRDYMVSEELRAADIAAWQDGLLAGYTLTPGETKYLPLDVVLNSQG